MHHHGIYTAVCIIYSVNVFASTRCVSHISVSTIYFLPAIVCVFTPQNNPKGLFTPKTRVFVCCGNSAADISNPIHLNGARWRTTFFRRRTSRCLQNLVRQRVPFKYIGFWYIRSRISATEKRASLVWIGPYFGNNIAWEIYFTLNLSLLVTSCSTAHYGVWRTK